MNHRTQCARAARGGTLGETLVMSGALFSAILGATYFYKLIGGYSGFVLGGFIGFVGFLLAVFALCMAYASFVTVLVEGTPWLPLCRNGCCREADYGGRKFDDGYFHVCKCGDRYERRGRDFLQVTESGERIVCRTWRPFRGWRAAGP